MDEFFLTFVLPTLLTALATLLAKRQGNPATIVARGAANGNGHGHRLSTDEWRQFVERDTLRDRTTGDRLSSLERWRNLTDERLLRLEDIFRLQQQQNQRLASIEHAVTLLSAGLTEVKP